MKPRVTEHFIIAADGSVTINSDRGLDLWNKWHLESCCNNLLEGSVFADESARVVAARLPEVETISASEPPATNHEPEPLLSLSEAYSEAGTRPDYSENAWQAYANNNFDRTTEMTMTMTDWLTEISNPSLAVVQGRPARIIRMFDMGHNNTHIAWTMMTTVSEVRAVLAAATPPRVAPVQRAPTSEEEREEREERFEKRLQREEDADDNSVRLQEKYPNPNEKHLGHR